MNGGRDRSAFIETGAAGAATAEARRTRGSATNGEISSRRWPSAAAAGEGSVLGVRGEGAATGAAGTGRGELDASCRFADVTGGVRLAGQW
jgi:hypothetical protein